MPRRVARLLVAAALTSVVAVGGLISVPQPVDAQWRDQEVATATLQAKTIPPVTLAGTAPFCSWAGAVTTTSISLQWSPPAGYASTTVQFVAQKGTNSQLVTGATTTVAGGVYTTTIPISILNAIGSLLGGSFVIHVTVVDPQTGWSSKVVDYTYVMTLAGIVTSCSATPAG